MRDNVVKQRMQAGECVFGPFMMLASPAVVEVVASAGYDFCLFDMEHGVFDIETIENCLRACDIHGVTGIVRPPDGSPQTVSKILDAGAQGLLVPHCMSGDQAARAAQAMVFGPPGMRGINAVSRAASYGNCDFLEFFRQSDEQVLKMVQIEDREGVDELDDIVATPGLDVVFVGPYDLSRSLGHLADVEHPVVKGAVEKIVTATAAQPGKLPGIYVGTPEQARYWADRGARFFAYGGDVGFLLAGAQETMNKLREVFPR